MMIVDTGDTQQSPGDPQRDCSERMGPGMIGKTTRTKRPYSRVSKVVKRVENGNGQTASAGFSRTQNSMPKPPRACV